MKSRYGPTSRQREEEIKNGMTCQMCDIWFVICDALCVIRNTWFVIRQSVWCDYFTPCRVDRVVFLLLFKDLSSNIFCLEERRATERSKHCSLFSSALALLVGSGVCVCGKILLQCVWVLCCCRQETPAIVPRENKSSNVCSEWNSLEGRKQQNSCRGFVS